MSQVLSQVVASRSGESDAHEQNAGYGEKADLIGRRISIGELMTLWDEGNGIAIYSDWDDEVPYIITSKMDFFDIQDQVFECFHVDNGSEDERFIEVVVVQ